MKHILKKALLVTVGGMALAAAVHAETIVSVTETHYDSSRRPDCVVVRMNPATFADAASSACIAKTAGTFGADRINKTVYDVAGQITQVIQGYGTANQRTYATYVYSLNGKVVDSIDANGNRTHLEYDGFDRLKFYRYPSTTRPSAFNPSTAANALATAGAYNASDYEQYDYDANGNKTYTRRRDGQVFNDCFDALNRSTVHYVHAQTGCAATGGAKDVYSTYDLQNHIVSKRFASAGGTGVSYAYDGIGRVTSTTDMNGRAIAYTYNAAALKVSLQFPDMQSQQYNYLANGILSSTSSSSGTVAVASSYDSLSRVISITRSNGAGSAFSYDGIGRLTNVFHDLTGTIHDITWSFTGRNPANQITQWGASSTSYDYQDLASNTDNRTYDGLNRDAAIAGLTGGYDARGNMTFDGVRTFTYDAENRLLTATGGAMPLTLEYDPEGRLARYTAGGTLTTFLYDGVNLIGEYNATGTIVRRYMHTLGTDQPWVQFTGSAVGPDNASFYYSNYQGSIIAMANKDGAVTELYKYGPYGEPLVATNVAVPKQVTSSFSGNRFRFTGQTSIPEANLYYYKARIYDPIAARFLQTDPIGSKDDLNLYAYVGGDPVNRSDPTGLCGETKKSTESKQDQCYGYWTQTTQEASPGQDGSARWGEAQIQDHYASSKGGEFVVDPQTMKMGTAIDIGKQMQDSINGGGQMSKVYADAAKSGKPVEFTFGPKRFTPGLVGDEGPAGRSIGRFAGVTTGLLSVDKKGSWTVSGTVSITADTYNWKLDAGVPGFIGAVTLNANNGYKPNYFGSDMTLVYNRQYVFKANGHGPS